MRKLLILLIATFLHGCSEQAPDSTVAPAPAPVVAPVIKLEGSSWQLVEIRDVADSVFVPSNPEDYLVRFRGESRMQVEADCNQAGATWIQDGTNLDLSQFFSTRALCPPPSLFNRYVMHLERVNSFRHADEQLVLQTADGNAALVFQPYIFNPLQQ